MKGRTGGKPLKICRNKCVFPSKLSTRDAALELESRNEARQKKRAVAEATSDINKSSQIDTRLKLNTLRQKSQVILTKKNIVATKMRGSQDHRAVW